MSRPRAVLVLFVVSPSCGNAPAFAEWTSAHVADDTTDDPATSDMLPTSITNGDTTGDTSTGFSTAGPGDSATTGDETTAAPVNEPPTVSLVLSPESIGAAGTVELAIEASDDVVAVHIFYRGELIDTVPPAAFPYPFEVTSRRKCDGVEQISIVADDAEGLGSVDSADLSCALPKSGSEAHQALLPRKLASPVHAVALHGDGFVAVGALDGRMAAWRFDADLQLQPGWPRTLPDWTMTAGLATLESSGSAVAVDPDLNIIVAGNTVKAGVMSAYVARLNPDGSLLAEAQGSTHEQAAGVTVTSDGVIVVAGAVKTGDQPARYDWRVWGYAALGDAAPWANTLPLGPGEELDLTNERSERARAVLARADGEVVVVGEREYVALDKPPRTRASWQAYTSAGARIGELWTSAGDALPYDGANAVVALSPDAFAAAGWARTEPGQPPRPMAWRFEDGVLTDYRSEPGDTAESKGVGRDREGNLVLATLLTSGGQLDAWSFAFAGWSSPKLWSQPPKGDPAAWDGYTSIACDVWGHCLAGGFLTIDGLITGFLRLHNP